MRTTLQLLNEVEKMGFNKDEALESIEPDNLYNDILEAFKDELDAIKRGV